MANVGMTIEKPVLHRSEVEELSETIVIQTIPRLSLTIQGVSEQSKLLVVNAERTYAGSFLSHTRACLRPDRSCDSFNHP